MYYLLFYKDSSSLSRINRRDLHTLFLCAFARSVYVTEYIDKLLLVVFLASLLTVDFILPQFKPRGLINSWSIITRVQIERGLKSRLLFY